MSDSDLLRMQNQIDEVKRELEWLRSEVETKASKSTEVAMLETFTETNASERLADLEASEEEIRGRIERLEDSAIRNPGRLKYPDDGDERKELDYFVRTHNRDEAKIRIQKLIDAFGLGVKLS
jgi:hypothetical protein